MALKEIFIKSTDAKHQYDEDGRAITTWSEKYCNWVVNPEFEKDYEAGLIDWYGEDSDFPAGSSLAEMQERYPDADNNPLISVRWYWNTKEACIRAFGLPHTFLGWNHPNVSNYWDIQNYPFTDVRSWNYYSRKDVPNIKEAIKQFGGYCDLDKKADKVVVRYDNEEKVIKGA